MTVLVVSDEYPWPPVNGSRIRIANVVEALRALGPVDVVCVVDEGGDEAAAARAGVRRVDVVPRPIIGGGAAVWRWLRSGLPREVSRRDWTAARSQVARIVARSAPFDLVWFTSSDAYSALGDLVGRPVVVDYDDLDSEKLAHRRRLGRRRLDAPGGAVRALAAAVADRLDERRWARLERAMAETADVVVVCSELDRSRLGVTNAAVVPNGYDPPSDAGPGRTRDDGGAPVLLFVGLLTYPPNIDAARLLADVILPAVREQVPNARLRLVGRAGPEARELAARPGVEVTGFVDDVGAELEAAALAVVPVRFGGGTRIKILEAFASGLPVVSTTVGAEGIDARPGVHLIVEDEPAAFAGACVRLLRDRAAGVRLAEAAAALHDERYRWERIRPAITRAAETALAHAR